MAPKICMGSKPPSSCITFIQFTASMSLESGYGVQPEQIPKGLLERLFQLNNPISNRCLECLLGVVTLPYYLVFSKYTKDPVLRILNEQTDDPKIVEEVNKWLDMKRREAIWIQVAVSKLTKSRNFSILKLESGN